MTPAQLKAFAAVVRNGSSKGAAGELGVSEAGISNHISALRKELDDRLFRRSGDGLVFTPGGLRLATRAVEMLGLQEQTRAEVQAAAEGQRLLRLAVSSLFGEYCAPGLIEAFTARAKDLRVEVAVHAPDRFEELLTTRASDLAIGPSVPALRRETDNLEFVRYQQVAVVARRHPLAG
ncbi:MAG: LysR family transcriptional regulator, partial [Acidimicrobiia bacterium]|nr:LysR family transcriptional regulator [Acidimicrobiia bacterium]